MSISPWGTAINSYPETWVQTLPSGVPSKTVRTVLTSNKQKPISANANLVRGWRNPTAFRAYVCEMDISSGYSYHAVSPGYPPGFQAFGDRSYPNDTNHLYAGTSGTGRFPRTSLNLQNRAQTEGLNKIKDSDLALGESLATLGQTYSLLADSILKMAKAMRAARRGDFAGMMGYLTGSRSSKYVKGRKKNDYANGISSSWLEYQYGWKPLVSDIMGLIALAKSAGKSNRMQLHAIRNLQENESPPARSGTVSYWSSSGSITSGAKFRVDVEITDSRLFLLDSIGLLNPFELGYNLIPFSFVLDWLIPIGNSLRALSSSLGISFLGASMTTYTIADFQIEWATGTTFVKGTPIKIKVKSLSTYRTTYNSLPTGRLYIKSPFSLTRAATALALFKQLR